MVASAVSRAGVDVDCSLAGGDVLAAGDGGVSGWAAYVAADGGDVWVVGWGVSRVGGDGGVGDQEKARRAGPCRAHGVEDMGLGVLFDRRGDFSRAVISRTLARP